MASPVVSKAATPINKDANSVKLKQGSAPAGKSPQVRPANGSAAAKQAPGKLSSNQSAPGKNATGQSGAGKEALVGQPAAGKTTASPGSKLSLGQASPRKSIFTKAVGLKLGSSHSPSKSLFAKGSPSKSSGSTQHDLPLALRKKRRPNAGMKRETPVFMDKILNPSKSPREGKAAPKRKLSQTSPNGSKIGAKNKADYVPPSSKKRKIARSNREQDARNDFYCWVCHKEGSVICCELCPRVYHPKCAKVEGAPIGDWFCPECERATNAECIDSQSQTMSSLTLDELAKLLLHALKRMKHAGAEPFLKPVNVQQNPGYEEFVFNPMDLSTLEKNVKKRMYGSTEAFLLDAKWILHNCIVFNGSHHKLTNSARMIIKICEYEMKEIEICPDCYLSASLKRDKWFCEVCRNPHKLVWARLQGFPFWPSKVVREKDGLLDVRFFGQHDRAWIPITSCYMYSPEIPNSSKKKTSGLGASVVEMEHHIMNLKKMFGKECFQYAPHRTAYRKFECLTLTPEDKAKWSASRAVMPLLSNGVDGTSTSSKPIQLPGNVKIKKEPFDTESMERYGEIKMVLGTTQDEKEPGTVREKEVTDSENDRRSSQEAQHQKSTKNCSEAEKDKQSPSDSSSKNEQMDGDAPSGKVPSVVRRQIFSVTRKKADVEKPPVKIMDTCTLSAESSTSQKVNASNTESDESEGTSPSKAPAGVFEVSDESLDVDPQVEAQSPAVQLLGKSHVSTNDFARSLSIKLNKVSPRTLGKIGRQISLEDQDSNEDSKTKEAMKQETQCEEIMETSPTTNESDKTPESEQSQSKILDKPAIITAAPLSPTTETSHSKNGRETPKSTSNDPKPSEGSVLEDIPSTSKSLPTKDKFHIKLEKTIETMKAFLGIERLHSVDKEASETESSAAESDSESSEAEHSDESDMEVDDDHGGRNAEKKLSHDTPKNSPSTQDNAVSSQTQQSDPVCQSDDGANPDLKLDTKTEKTTKDKRLPDSRVELEDVPGPSTPKKTKVDSDIDLAMSCHSEMSDSDEGGLVIDESRSGNQPKSKQEEINSSPGLSNKKIKEHSSKAQDDNAPKEDIRDNLAPMETDAVMLAPDPYEKGENNETDKSKTEEAGSSSPVPSTPQEEIKNETTDQPSQSPKVTSNSPPAVPNNDPQPSPVSSNLPLVPQKLTLSSVDQARSQEVSLSSFPKIIETLQATKRPQVMTTPAENDKNKNEKDLSTDTTKEAPGTSSDKSVEESTVPPHKDADTRKRQMYKKYVTKITTAVEEMLDDFTAEFSEEMPLKDAEAQLVELGHKVKQLTWEREQEKQEYKQILELAVAEMKECMEAESKIALANLRAQLEAEKQEEIRKTKTKQWCANCGKDAVFFCCWNTSYCDYPCQQNHWSVHRNSCQQRSLGNTVMQVQSVQNKQITPAISSATPTSSTSEIIKLSGPGAAGKSASEQLRLISSQQANPSGSLDNQTSQPIPMQLHQTGHPNIQQQINQSANQSHHQSTNQQPLLSQSANQQPLHRTLQQQVQQVMQPPPPASSQPMQTLIQYVQAPRMSAPLPVRQLINHNPFTMSQGRMVGGTRTTMRLVRP